MSMCGICGVVDIAGAGIPEATIRAMARSLSHRGPDGEGFLWAETDAVPAASLGHTRLKVIDLRDVAAQPLSNEDGSVFVTYNGEIYNFRELRKDLQTKGHRFRSASDTEVLVHGYEEYGDAVVDRLDGMFAFGLWDARKRRLLIARDPCGKKPLYYSFDGSRFIFASEIKSLLQCSWVEDAVAEDLIPEYLVYGYVAAPRTLYRGIMQLPPGCYAVVDGGGLHDPRRFWHVRFGSSNGLATPSLDEAADEVKNLVTAAVRKRLVSDVALGAFLSGGVDSAVIVGLMSKMLDEPVRTFTIGFSDSSYDESEAGRSTAQYFGSHHTGYVVEVEAVDLVDKLLWHYDQPFGDSSAIPTYVVSELARREVTVALVGDGSDEIFAGYDRFLAARFAQFIPSWLNRAARVAAPWIPSGSSYFHWGRRLKRFADDGHLPVEVRYRRWVSAFSDAQLSDVLVPELRTVAASAVHRHFDDALARAPGPTILDRLMEVNFETNLPYDLLVKMDRMSMAHSLETRSPFLDRSLIEYVAALPVSYKIRAKTLKYLLKRAFRGLLPPAVLRRPKHGFGIPLGTWFRSGLGEMFRDLVLDQNARAATYVDLSNADRLFSEHTQYQAEHGYRLWSLLNLELWLRRSTHGSGRLPGERTPLKLAVRES